MHALETPQEVLEQILNFICDDYDTLQACALVHRKWRRPSQRTIFLALRLTNGPRSREPVWLSPSMAYNHFASYPHLSSYTRCLEIDDHVATAEHNTSIYQSSVLHSLLRILPPLHKIVLQSLIGKQLVEEFVNNRTKWVLTETLRDTLPTLLKSKRLTHLELRRFQDIPILDLLAPRSLASLKLDSVTFVPFNLEDMPLEPGRMMFLSSFHLNATSKEIRRLLDFLDDCGSPVDFSKINDLAIETDDQCDDLRDLFEFIQNQKVPEKLKITADIDAANTSPSALLFSTDTHPRMLTWTIYIAQQDYEQGILRVCSIQWLLASLQTFSLSHPIEIVIEVGGCHHTHNIPNIDLDLDQVWNDLDSLLSQPNFRLLTSVTFEFKDDLAARFSPGLFVDLVGRRLPKLEESGRLVVDVYEAGVISDSGQPASPTESI